MKAAPFDYARAATLEDVFRLRRSHQEGSRILAGGQSLLATLAFRLSEPKLLIDITRVPDLKGITVTDTGAVYVGALTTHAELASSEIVRGRVPVLAEAARLIAHPAIRNRGTIGGSLAYADPAAELPACCVALDASIIAAGPAGRRTIPAGQFFTGLFTTMLADDEVIAGVEFAPSDPGASATILEVARRSGDYAVAGVAVSVSPSRCPKVVFFGVADRPVLARRAGDVLGASPWSASTVTSAQSALDHDLDPPADQHGGPALKRQLARVLLGRAMANLAGSPRKGLA